VILLCGIPTEPPLELVASELRGMGEGFVFLHQRRWSDCDAAVEVANGEVTGRLRLGPLVLRLEDITGVFTRLMDDRFLPDVRGLPATAPPRARCRAFHDTVTRWSELTTACVVNRSTPQASNASKPYQAQLIRRHGLRIPETLVTNDPESVRRFRSQQGRLIFKSLSGVRSVVRELTDADMERLDAIRWCPVQFQALIPGIDVRVHCIGGELFAARIESGATDYRYAAREVGEPPSLTDFELESEVAERCLRLTADLGLELAGIDLRVTPDDETYCFEVNPSPAFSYYEAQTGQPIARAIARHLAAA
jgi:glutathione synthase/RimK-type ligase-like ATP-grasp enzyme